MIHQHAEVDSVDRNFVNFKTLELIHLLIIKCAGHFWDWSQISTFAIWEDSPLVLPVMMNYHRENPSHQSGRDFSILTCLGEIEQSYLILVSSTFVFDLSVLCRTLDFGPAMRFSTACTLHVGPDVMDSGLDKPHSASGNKLRNEN